MCVVLCPREGYFQILEINLDESDMGGIELFNLTLQGQNDAIA